MTQTCHIYVLQSISGSAFVLPCWIQRADKYEIAADIPGVDKADLKVELDRQGRLHIRASRTTEKESDENEEGVTWHRTERSTGLVERVVDVRSSCYIWFMRFLLSVQLPDDVNVDDIQAAYKDGVLKVTVGKLEEAKTVHRRQIDVL